MLEIITAVLVILGAWFLLRIDLALQILIFCALAAAAIGIYWVCTGDWANEIAKGLGIFTLLVSILGLIRVATEKVSDTLAALLPPPFGTRRK